ncbi:peptidoglycan LD-endopeptidase [Microcoleus phage My-WqHQDG]|nr:peptidoglycan LD-endopeptidase [Microcoleus phage My-WqHQDG]
MPVGEDLINRTTHIPASDKPAFIQGLNAISDELGISRDFLPIIMVTETGVDGTIDPSAGNKYCGGLIQFCSGGGADEVGLSPSAIAAKSAVEQLPLIRQYLSNKGIPKGADLATTYLSILYPAAMSESKGANLGYIPQQSDHLYGPGGSLSKETIEAGLLAKARAGGSGLASPFLSGDKAFSMLPSNKSTSPPPSNGSASLGTNGGSIIIGTYTRDCTKTPPWDWTMQGGKVYRGCALKITTLGIQGGLSSTPMVGAMTTSNTSKATMTNAMSLSKGNVTPPKPGTLLHPVPGVPINSPMGMRWGRMHNGVDMAAATGTPILAAMDGVIDGKGYQGTATSGYGNYVAIRHADGSISETFYAHLQSYTDLPVGAAVKAGDVIGTMGSTGGSTGPHLHFEVRDGSGQRIDPASVLPPS